MQQIEVSMVELSDSREIAALLAGSPQPKRITSPARNHNGHRGAALRRCKCGDCATCLENARWEKIFNEKFADPNYYKPKPVKHTSSLG